MRYLLLITTFLLVNNLYAQDNINHEELIGFGCYAGGTYSDVVYEVTFDLEKNKYKKVIKKLKSNNPAEQYLAVIVAERLAESNQHLLTAENKALIQKAYHSKALVSVCSGCSYFEQIELGELLKKNDENMIWSAAKYWLNIYIGTAIKN